MHAQVTNHADVSTAGRTQGEAENLEDEISPRRDWGLEHVRGVCRRRRVGDARAWALHLRVDAVDVFVGDGGVEEAWLQVGGVLAASS
jgi:hypothetical protein